MSRGISPLQQECQLPTIKVARLDRTLKNVVMYIPTALWKERLHGECWKSQRVAEISDSRAALTLKD